MNERASLLCEDGDVIPRRSGSGGAGMIEQLLAEVAAEMARQDARWGIQDHPDGTGRPGDAEMATLDRAKCKANGPKEDNWRDILQEEVSEAFAETDPAKLRAELVQVEAVCAQWRKAIDQRTGDGIQ